MRRALITGGAGFIGSHLTDHLVARGWDVTILDDLSTGSEANLSSALSGQAPGKARLVEGSVTDLDTVTAAAAGVDVIFHLAAAVGVLNIQHNTLESLHTNLRGTECALDAAREMDAAIVVASTSEVYGKNTTIGLTEDADRILGSPLLARWSYAQAKALDETLAYQHHLTHGLRVVIIRPFNTTGPRQVGRYGMVLPRLIRQALAGEPLTVYGDGNQTRCFVHVSDVAPAIAKLAVTPDAVGNAYNLGSREQVSINDLAQRIIDRTGSPSTITHIDYETAYGPGFEDMERRVPNCERIRRLIGWAPTFNLNQIIDSIVAAETAKLAAT